MNISDVIIYKDNQLLVFNKPAGLPAQSDKTKDKSLLDLAEIYSKKKLWVTNRIDRPASGISIFAKTPKAAAHINALFAGKEVIKKYLAAVSKGLEEKGEMSHFIQLGRSNKVRVSDKEVNGGKPAILSYAKVKALNSYDIIEIVTQTGRHHQIRAQLAFAGYPIKGDVKYGARRSNKDRSIHLHCSEIRITHPISKDEIILKALPSEADSIWSTLYSQS